ncbi:MAG: FKBP-type peptidyl-prolyl cis-trans isomerase [Gammaproteobacteria bacterium]|nr:FKBP-type peptidyl-prolyl cis-trans isomerase [Gammaproteobacteria bacterium]
MQLRFAVTLEDGTVAESNFTDSEPLEIHVGDGTFPEALELCLLGLREGQRDTRRLYPEQAWGLHDPGNRQQIALRDFPPDIAPETGQIIEFELPDGDEVLGTLIGVTGDYAEVDFNHPLAGHTIEFEVEIVSVAPPQ